MNEVDAWFEQRQPAQVEPMQLVRAIILGCDPRIGEVVKWQTPTFVFEGNMASFNPSKGFVSLMFHRGSELPGRHPRLTGDGKLVRTMRFADVEEVLSAKADIEAAVAAWIEMKGG